MIPQVFFRSPVSWEMPFRTFEFIFNIYVIIISFYYCYYQIYLDDITVPNNKKKVRKLIWYCYFPDISPAGIYLFKVNNGNIKTMNEVCSSLIMKTQKLCFVSFSQISHVSSMNFEQVNADWVKSALLRRRKSLKQTFRKRCLYSEFFWPHFPAFEFRQNAGKYGP